MIWSIIELTEVIQELEEHELEHFYRPYKPAKNK